MNNKEKAWMLIGQHMSAYKSYRDRMDWERSDIFRAKRVCIAEHKKHAVDWASDPEIKKLVQEELNNALACAYQGMSLVVGCLKGLMAGDRPDSVDYPMEEIISYASLAQELMEEGDGKGPEEALPERIVCPVCNKRTAYKQADGLITCPCLEVTDD